MDANAMFHKGILLFEGGKMYNRTPNVREFQDCLNLAQIELIKERYAKWKNRPQLGYGDSSIRNAELAGLVTATKRITRDKFIQGTADNGALPGPDRDATTLYNAGDNSFTYVETAKFGVFVPVPDEAMYILYESSSTVNNDSIPQWNVTVREITYEQYNNEIYNYYKQPFGDTTWSLDWGAYSTGTLSNGLYSLSTKDRSINGTTQNMIGYAPITTGGILLGLTPAVTTIGHYYQVRVTGNASLTYNGITYTSTGTGTIILASSGISYTTVPGTGTAGLYDITALISTDRAKYVLTGSGWKLVEYTMHYIKTPSDIVVNIVTPSLQKNCELADFLHDEIVKKAVAIYSASIVPEPNKYEVNSMETLKQE